LTLQGRIQGSAINACLTPGNNLRQRHQSNPDSEHGNDAASFLKRIPLQSRVPSTQIVGVDPEFRRDMEVRALPAASVSDERCGGKDWPCAQQGNRLFHSAQ
jgi:hypothetical protein